MRFIEQLRDTWDADAMEAIGDFIDAADRVVVRFIWRGMGHGPQSNMEFAITDYVNDWRRKASCRTSHLAASSR